MSYKEKQLQTQLRKLQYQKSQNWNVPKSDMFEVLTCERRVLQFLQQWAERMDDVQSIKDYSLFDFWRWIQKEKDDMWMVTAN